MMTGFEEERGNRRARLAQLVVLGLVVAGFGGLLASFWWPAPVPVAPPAAPDIVVPSLGESPAEESWLSLGATQLRDMERRLAGLEARLATADGDRAGLAARNAQLEAQLAEQAREARAVIDAQAAVIAGDTDIDGAGVGDPFAALPAAPPPASPSAVVPDASAGQAGDPFAVSGGAADPLAARAPSLVRFELTPRPGAADRGSHEEDVRDTAFYLPAGAHAPAVITTGAAASVSVTGQADPRPVLMRITGRARTAADGRGGVLEADIRGCTIVGEARGDLSSERVYVRLRTMTCRRGRGVVETPVQGFVAGTGQAGVRGSVITREGDLVEKSAMAGVLSGFGGAAAQGLRPPAIVGTAADGTVRRPSDREILEDAGKAGLAQGIGNAGDRLAQYYINRAEQYQPVVSLKGGAPVEVVFIAGTYLDGRGLEDRARDGTAPPAVAAVRGGG